MDPPQLLGVCNLYSDDVAGDFGNVLPVKPVDGVGLQTFYDEGCFNCPSATPAPSSTSTSAALNVVVSVF